MRDRLIEILRKSGASFEYALPEEIADHLIAEGVIVPPFPAKIGDKVYRIMCRGYKDLFIREETIWIVDNHANAGVEVITKFIDGKGLSYFPKVEKDAIGKTVFLTREEAEKALAERSENGK